MEMIQAMRLLDILTKNPKDKTGENELQIFVDGKRKLSEQDLQKALGTNKQPRLDDKIRQVYEMYEGEYEDFFGPEYSIHSESD